MMLKRRSVESNVLMGMQTARRVSLRFLSPPPKAARTHTKTLLPLRARSPSSSSSSSSSYRFILFINVRTSDERSCEEMGGGSL